MKVLELETQQRVLPVNSEQTQGIEQTHLDALEAEVELLFLSRQNSFVKWTNVLDINRRLLCRLGVQPVFVD